MRTLAFELQKHKGLREDNPLQFYKMVNLLEVLRFCAEEFVKITCVLIHLQKFPALTGGEAQRKQIGHLILPHLTELRRIHSSLGTMGLTASADSAARVIAALDDPEWTNVAVGPLATALIDNIVSDFRHRYFVMIPPTHAQHYREKGTFLGEAILSKYCDLTKDAEEAGNCFALGLHTACVFHLMRIMERLVQEFLSEVGAEVTHKGQLVELKYAEWHEIEDAIQGKIKDMAKGERKSRCSAALTTIGAVRLGIRNETMHPRGNYDEEDARKLLINVKSFVQDIATLPTS